MKIRRVWVAFFQVDRQIYRHNQANIYSPKFFDRAYKLFYCSVVNVPRPASSVLGLINILFSAR